MKIYSLLPLLYSELEHYYGYNLGVQKAVQRNSWEHFCFIPKSCVLKELPISWKRALPNTCINEKNFFRKKIFYFLQFFKHLSSYANIVKNLPKDSVLFLEHFLPIQFFSLFIVLLYRRPQIFFWICLHRKPNALFRILLRILSRQFKSKMCIQTHSEVLQRAINQKLKVYLLPIPHAETPTLPKFNHDGLLFWWPGNTLRKEKGLDAVRHLIDLFDTNVKFVVSYPAKKLLPDKENFYQLVAYSLPRNEYAFWMQNVDFILLPYCSKRYRYSISGIFVESIFVGTMPLVSDGTWMAYELKKFSLDRLIIDWKRADLMEEICALHTNPDVKKQLADMQKAYSGYYSIETYAKKLLEMT